MILTVLAMLVLQQDVSAKPVTQPSPAAAVAPDTCGSILAGTALQIEVVDAIGSKTAKIGDFFKIRLAEPLILDGKTILTAGIQGVGEIIHASHPRFMTNKVGELIVAARYLDLGDKRLPLRGFRIDRAGAYHITILSRIGPIPNAQNVDIPAGSIATAKVAGSCIPLPRINEQQEVPK
ncbi:hypothetical protein [Sphingomonas sp.]|uniref:hypothetical protein n=1 Tax=Sphingomonas sp. TaxID=28214 RepID=UPI003D6D445C